MRLPLDIGIQANFLSLCQRRGRAGRQSGGRQIPARGHSVVLRHALAIGVHMAQTELGTGVTRIGDSSGRLPSV